MRQAFLPGFADDVPLTIVVAELDEQTDLTLIGRLVDGPDAALAIGDRVEVTFDRLETGEAVPAFRLAPVTEEEAA